MNNYLFDSKNHENVIDELLYGKKPKEALASKLLRHFGYCSAGAYVGFLVSRDLPLALLSLGLAWGSVAARRYVLKYRE